MPPKKKWILKEEAEKKAAQKQMRYVEKTERPSSQMPNLADNPNI